jgi:hypothetical protein
MSVGGDWVMRVVAWIAVLVMVLARGACGAQPAMEGAEGRKAFEDLAARYAGRGRIDSQAMWKQLAASDPEVRASAGRYLLALCRQTWEDEVTGRTTLDPRPPGFGARPESEAREIREYLAEFLPEHAAVEMLPAIEWLLKNDIVAKTRLKAMEALCKIRSAEADRIVLELVTKPYPLGGVVAQALVEVEKRDLRAAAGALPALAVHFRGDVRQTARALAEKWGVAGLPEFKAEEAVAPFDGVLRETAAMVYPAIPPDASFVQFKETHHPRRQGPDWVEEGWAWVLSEDVEGYRLMNQFGSVRSAPRALTALTPATLAQWAEWLLKLRTDEHKNRDAEEAVRGLSPSGMLSGQFEPEALRLPEVLAAAWAYERGDRATAAAVMLPRLEALADERWYREIARDMLGHQYDEEMLEAFVDERDYEKALGYAKHLTTSPFVDFEYQGRAEKLLRELPERMKTDFVSLTLPSPAEWKRIRGGMSRAKQVRYLSDRLRLLNVRQPGWPAEMDYNQPQRSVALGEGGYPYVDYGRGEARINPYNELLAMRLEPADLQTLLPYVSDEDFILGFHFWRPWSPTWHLIQVNELVEKLANEAAGRRFVKLYDYYQLPEDKRAEYVAQAQQRAGAMHGRWIQALADFRTLEYPYREIQTNWIVAGTLGGGGLIWAGLLRKRSRVAALGAVCLVLAGAVTFWYPALVRHRCLMWLDCLPLGMATVAAIGAAARQGKRPWHWWLGGMVLAAVAGYCSNGMVRWNWTLDGAALAVILWMAILLVAVKGKANRVLGLTAILGGAFGLGMQGYPSFEMRRYGLFTLPDPTGLLEWWYPIAAAVLGAACLALLLVMARVRRKGMATT